MINDDDRYTRQIALFGSDGQDRIKNTHIGLVGLGGLGSHLAQQFAYLGIEHYTLIDGDTASSHSLNRLVSAVPTDVGTHKTELAERLIRAVKPTANIANIPEHLDDIDAYAALRDAELIVGGLDSDLARLQLTDIASTLGIVYLDAATDILTTGGSLVYGGRILTCGLTPGGLSCLDLLDQREIRHAGMTDAERAAEAAIYGVPVDALETGMGPPSSPSTASSPRWPPPKPWSTSPDYAPLSNNSSTAARKAASASTATSPPARAPTAPAGKPPEPHRRNRRCRNPSGSRPPRGCAATRSKLGLQFGGAATCGHQLGVVTRRQPGLAACVDQVVLAPVVDRLITDLQIEGDLRHRAAGLEQIENLATRRISPRHAVEQGRFDECVPMFGLGLRGVNGWEGVRHGGSPQIGAIAGSRDVRRPAMPDTRIGPVNLIGYQGRGLRNPSRPGGVPERRGEQNPISCHTVMAGEGGVATASRDGD